MKCEEIRERMPDVAAGFSEVTTEESNHLAGCNVCTEQLKSMKATMGLLEEWQTPEPSPYFDIRLQARLREEMAKPQAGWLHWFRRPVLAAALTVIMGVGVGIILPAATMCIPARFRSRMWAPARQSAICKPWRRTTICIRILSCSTIWTCSKMFWPIRKTRTEVRRTNKTID